jgi:hypothetical protein
MLLSWLVFRIATATLVANQGGTSLTNLSLLLGTLGILRASINAACWAAIITAVFGWRNAPGGSPPAPLQFSIRGLIAVTFGVALLFGLMRALIGYFGDTALSLVQLVDDLPVIVCLGVGIWIAAARWQRHPAVSNLAVWAFALAIAGSILPQLIIMAVFDWVSDSPLFFVVFSLIFTIASATSWGLAIAAALGWRDWQTLPGNAGEISTNAGGAAYARHP